MNYNQKLLSIKYTIVCIVLLILAYKFRIDPFFYYLDVFAAYWNLFVDYILNFRDKEPYIFMLIPVAIIYFLIPPREDTEHA